MFWKYLLGLFVWSMVFPFIYAFLIMPVFALLAGGVAAKETGSRTGRIASWSLFLIAGLLNYYVLLGWAAYAVARTFIYTSDPTVINVWAYYLAGFYVFLGPMSFMASKEARDSSAGSFFGTLVIALAFIVFSIWPALMTLPYGWFLRWVLPSEVRLTTP